jgi:hypothetical protein
VGAGLQQVYRVWHVFDDVAEGDDIKAVGGELDGSGRSLMNLQTGAAAGDGGGLGIGFQANGLPAEGVHLSQKVAVATTDVE